MVIREVEKNHVSRRDDKPSIAATRDVRYGVYFCDCPMINAG